MTYNPTVSRTLLLAPLDIQETTCCLVVDVVYGLQLMVVYVSGNEVPDDDWHAVWIGVKTMKK